MEQKEFKFKKLDGTHIEDVEKYVKNWMEEKREMFPNSNIIIGCDSQIHGRRIKYSIVVCMHMIDRMKMGKGCHVISADIWEKRINKSPLEEMPTKLWREAEYVLAVAQLVDGKDEMFRKRITVHLDFNSEENRGSNFLYAAGVGYITAMGYKALGKPESQVASITADHYCR
jgi:predicted RNase H-related nuclease YkuK (DUF458 family)